MTNREFSDKFKQIKELGYIPAKRKGPAGNRSFKSIINRICVT
jgi:hypothetical protein